MIDLYLLYQIYAFIFGALFGSFLNVVIYRVPENKSVVFPPSRCPVCQHKIKWYENIPILSWIFLRGKCSGCKTKISFQYPLIELLMGLASFFLFPGNLDFNWISLVIYLGKYFVFFIFVAHFMIDIKHKILPDGLNIFLMILFLPYVISYFSPYHYLVGGLIGFLGPLSITYLFYKLKGQVGLGGGDIKLYGILGLYLGPLGILNNIFLSSMSGTLFALALILTGKMKRDQPIAFGPFIIIIAVIQIYFPQLYQLISLIPY